MPVSNLGSSNGSSYFPQSISICLLSKEWRIRIISKAIYHPLSSWTIKQLLYLLIIIIIIIIIIQLFSLSNLFPSRHFMNPWHSSLPGLHKEKKQTCVSLDRSSRPKAAWSSQRGNNIIRNDFLASWLPADDRDLRICIERSSTPVQGAPEW